MVDIDATRARLRRTAIRRALYPVWPRAMGFGLIAEALPEDLAAGRDELDRALRYLSDKCEVVIDTQAYAKGANIYRLTATGVDRVEDEDDFSPERARLVRMLRLRVLQALDLGGPQAMGTKLISLALAEDTDLDLSEPSLRRALFYLCERGLAIGAKDAYRITADGIDYLAGDGEQVAGLARPAKW